MTEIGERGINLSGGQKARVSLARALYDENTKIMLFDDPLSAVDTHVGEELLNNALMGDITSGVTRILVTHHVHVLARCDKVIVLEAGEIKHFGTFDDLVAEGVDFAGAVDFEGEEDIPDVTDESDVPSKNAKNEINVNDSKKEASLREKGKNLTTKEDRAEGAVDGSLYLRYGKAGGIFTCINFFIVQAIGRRSEIGGAFWLAYWAKEAYGRSTINNSLDNEETMYYLNIYAVLRMGGVLCLAVRAILIAYHRLNASRLLHENLTGKIVLP